MSRWPNAPVLFEIDTWPWLADVSASAGRPLTLGEVPADVWRRSIPPGTDAVWLMGVWERSPAGLAVARRDPRLGAAFRAALPDLGEADVVGSPYCVRRYRVERTLGGREGLAAARRTLAGLGLRLVLDYVPNHVAPDHPAVTEHPEFFVGGTSADLARDPEAWVLADGRVLARGRDPYFPPWPDVLQLNAFHPGLRRATAEVLSGIGEQCDGVRCDMAMLMTNEVFARTWGERAGRPPAEEFWPEVLRQVRRRHPGLLFVAEAYWDLEWTLQQQGFDLAYDKRLYDRLVTGDAGSVRAHLLAAPDYQHRLLRFTENHDEPRAATALPEGRNRAAAVAVATLPGATLWHDGQFEGRRTQLPVFLARRPPEPPDEGLRTFGHRLTAAVAAGRLREGDWELLECHGWPDNPTSEHLLAWSWENDGVPASLVVVNFSDRPAQGRVRLPRPSLRGRTWRLAELLGGPVFERDGDQLAGDGLFVSLPPWGFHLLCVGEAS